MARTTLNTIKHDCYQMAGVTSTAQLKRRTRGFDLRKPSEWVRLRESMMADIVENDD